MQETYDLTFENKDIYFNLNKLITRCDFSVMIQTIAFNLIFKNVSKHSDAKISRTKQTGLRQNPKTQTGQTQKASRQSTTENLNTGFKDNLAKNKGQGQV